PARTSRPRSSRLRNGRTLVHRICSRLIAPASSRSAMRGAATSSEWRRPSAKGRSPSRLCIGCFDRKGCHVRSELCPYHWHCQRQAPQTTGVPGVRQDRRNLGSSPYLSGVRWHALLRQLAQPSRDEARSRDGASGYRIGGAWRALALLLSGRCVCRILITALSPFLPEFPVQRGGADA